MLDGGATQAEVRRAEARALTLRVEEEEARRRVALEVRERSIELDAARAGLALAETRLAAAETALEAERAQYLAGETALQAVSQARSRVVDARETRARLAVEARFTRRLLDVAVGG